LIKYKSMMKRPVFLRTTDSFYSHINVNIYRKSTSFILLLLRKKYAYLQAIENRTFVYLYRNG
jgi:hypothetical protein